MLRQYDRCLVVSEAARAEVVLDVDRCPVVSEAARAKDARYLVVSEAARAAGIAKEHAKRKAPGASCLHP